MTTPRDAIGLSERLREQAEYDDAHGIMSDRSAMRQAAAQLDDLWREINDWANEVARYKSYAEKFDEENAVLSARVKELESKNEKLNLHLQYFVERVEYSDSYGVPGSGFVACLCCRGGGAPHVPMIHEDHCPVGRSLDAFQEWCDEQREFEAESAANAKRAHDAESRATRAEQERDEAYERAAKVAEQFGEPYALHSNPGSMMCLAQTQKIADAIRRLAAGSDKEKKE